MISKLQDICFYVTEKMFIAELTDKNSYISTENMLPDKGGITVPSTIPTDGKITAYKKNDVLVSNIRPYFKKIWFALSDGGCSNDVLVFRAKEGISPDYLHYILADNTFFDYTMKTSKGTKMPRGDKKAIMEYEVAIMGFENQQKTSSILRLIDQRIAINTAINENLEQQAQAIFKSWLVDFEPFGGVMPDDWTETTLGTIATISTKSMNPLKQPDLYLEHYSIPAYDEQRYPVFEYASEIKSNKYILTNNSVMISKLNPDTKRIWRPLCLSANPVCSTEFIVYEAVNPKYKDYIYSLIDSQAFSDYLCAHTTGSTNSRQRATPKATLDYTCVMPSDDIITRFCGIVTPMYDQIAANTIENQHLAALRDTLLPKLMNGEIDVSAVKI